MSDGTQVSDTTADVQIELAAVNDAPVAVDDAITVTAGTSVGFLLEGTDVDGDDDLTYVVTGTPSFGSFVQSGSFISYTPFANHPGTDFIDFTVEDDGGLVSSVGRITVTVVEPNSNPNAEGADLFTDEDVAVSVELVASDPDGDFLAF